MKKARRRFLYVAGGAAALTLLGYNLFSQPKAVENKTPAQFTIEGEIEKINVLDSADYTLRTRNSRTIVGGVNVAVYDIKSDSKSLRLVGMTYPSVKAGDHYSIVYLDDKEVTLSEVLERNILMPVQKVLKDIQIIQTSADVRKTYRYDGHIVAFLKSKNAQQ